MKVMMIVFSVGLVFFGLGYWAGYGKMLLNEVNATDSSRVIAVTLKTIEAGNKNGTEDFDNFIDKFIADSLFQLERIKFPLKSSIQTSLDVIDSTSIVKVKWKITRLFGNEEYVAQTYDNFKGELGNTNERLFCWEGVENGINVEYKFSRIAGLWYLIEYNDFSD